MPATRRTGFTLAEMLLVMVLVGILMGFGLSGIDRMDPGARGLATTLETFIQTSRDRARATGQPVTLQFEEATAEVPGRFVRRVFRPILEATFETQVSQRENLIAVGSGRLDRPGRFGAGLDLSLSGGAQVMGRGGQAQTSQGLQVGMDFRTSEGGSAHLLVWEDVIEVSVRRDGALVCEAIYGDDEGSAPQQLASEAGLVVPGRWYRVRALALPGRMEIHLDGRRVAEREALGRLNSSDVPPFLGDPDGDFLGHIDEFVVWAVATEIGPELRETQGAFVGALQVVFDRFGQLDEKLHPEPVEVRVSDLDNEILRLRIGRFTEEEMP